MAEVEGNLLEIEDLLSLDSERAVGHIVGNVYPGCIGGYGQSDEEAFFAEYMKPYFCVVKLGAMAGEIIGPLHGSCGLNEFEDCVEDFELAPVHAVHCGRGPDWWEVMEEGDERVLLAQRAWPLLDEIVDQLED